MAIEIIEGQQAYANLNSSNGLSRWPRLDTAERIYPVAYAECRPKFGISRTDKVFCIGSCFTREIEQAMSRMGFNVLSVVRNLPRSPNRTHADAGSFNKYTVASILNEIRWTLDPEHPYSHDQVLVEASRGLYEDYQVVGNKYTDTRKYAEQFRDGFNKAFSRIRQADLVIFMLGLSEAWFDNQTGLYLNHAPSPALTRRYPGRFALHTLEYEETLSALESIHGLMREYLKPSLRILITVSPVPLNLTFRQQDVMTANAYSKAILRAAVEKFVHYKPLVSYFPCYEMGTLSHPLCVRGDRDLRHVDPLFVDYVMQSSLAAFMEEDDLRAGLTGRNTDYHGQFQKKVERGLPPVPADAYAPGQSRLESRSKHQDTIFAFGAFEPS